MTSSLFQYFSDKCFHSIYHFLHTVFMGFLSVTDFILRFLLFKSNITTTNNTQVCAEKQNKIWPSCNHADLELTNNARLQNTQPNCPVLDTPIGWKLWQIGTPTNQDVASISLTEMFIPWHLFQVHCWMKCHFSQYNISEFPFNSKMLRFTE